MRTILQSPGRKRWILGLAVSVSLLAGCGSSDKETADASGSDTPVVTEATGADSDATAAAVAAESVAPSGEGPAGVNVSQTPMCKLVSTDVAKALFGDLKIDTPAPEQNSCGLFAKPEGAVLGRSLQLMPVLIPLDAKVEQDKALGYTVEELSGIGDRAVYIAGDVEGFAPSRQVVFTKGEITYTVSTSFADGSPAPDAATVKAIIVPIATEYARVAS